MAKRNEITKHYYPDKVSAKEFVKLLKDDLKMFVDNMEDLAAKKSKGIDEKAYVEEWCGTFFAWMEMKLD